MGIKSRKLLAYIAICASANAFGSPSSLEIEMREYQLELRILSVLYYCGADPQLIPALKISMANRIFKAAGAFKGNELLKSDTEPVPRAPWELTSGISEREWYDKKVCDKLKTFIGARSYRDKNGLDKLKDDIKAYMF